MKTKYCGFCLTIFLAGTSPEALALSQIKDGDQQVLVEPVVGMNFIQLEPGCSSIIDIPTRVCVDGFAMGRFEVTNQQYRAFDPAHDSGKLSGIDLGAPESPAVNVSWLDANGYADWLSRQSGLIVRLPSEAEWQYAAQGGTGGAWFWGDLATDAFRFANLSDRDANERLIDGFDATAPIGSFDPNPFGLFDMLGNVSEWVADAYSNDPKRYGDHTSNPVVKTGDGPLRVRRGGSFDQRISQVSATARDFYLETLGVPQTGFRLVLELPE